MKPLQASSGDVLADRRADYAEMLFASGDHAPAAELLLGALELAPGWTLGWFRLGEMHEAAGDFNAAASAWETTRRLDPEDRAGAGLKLALIGQIPEPEAPPSLSSRRCSISMPPVSTIPLSASSATACPTFCSTPSGRRRRAAFAWRSTSAAEPA